eukprot:8001542-Prorocentrum_lima.AAC.1
MSPSRELQARTTIVPNIMLVLENWLEDYVTKLELGRRMGCHVKPRVILRMVNNVMERVLRGDV